MFARNAGSYIYYADVTHTTIVAFTSESSPFCTHNITIPAVRAFEQILAGESTSKLYIHHTLPFLRDVQRSRVQSFIYR